MLAATNNYIVAAAKSLFLMYLQATPGRSFLILYKSPKSFLIPKSMLIDSCGEATQSLKLALLRCF
eukprot:c51902_g1_i1 orf=2-196(-)